MYKKTSRGGSHAAEPLGVGAQPTTFSKRRVFLLAFLIFSALTILSLWMPGVGSASGPTVDPRVLEDTADGRTGAFLVVLKLQANASAAAARAPNRQARGRLVFDALRQAVDATQPAVRAHLDALGAKYRAYWIVNLFAVEGDRAVVDAMAARPDVAAIESNRSFRVPLEQPQTLSPSAPTAIEWNISQVNAPQVWAKGYTGQGMVYANADTGVQWDHPALKPHYRGWNGTTADHNYNWWDAVHADLNGNGTNPCNPSGFTPLPSSGSLAPCDDHGHGTHTMGTGIGDDGAGNQIGMAPGAKWIACRNMEQDVGQPSTYIECMQFFIAPTDLNGNNSDPSKRPDAVGNSYTCPPSEGCSANSLLTAMDNMRAAGIFMAASAGNYNGSAPCSSITDPPAIYDSAITIGATDSTDTITSFSERGPITVDSSNRRKPDLVAPGVNVRSSWLTNTYANQSGTSMASPHVAGAVVLLWSRFPQLVRDVDTTESIFEQNALHLTTAQGCGGDTSSQVPNNVYGYGRLDVLAAFDYADSVYFPFKYYFPFVSK